MEEKLTYKEALSQLEALVEKIENPQCDLTSLSEDLIKAMDLVKFCKSSLKGIEDNLTQLLNQN